MKKELLRPYALTIANTIMTMSRGFGPRLDQFDFMLVTQPKVPFATDENVPNITFTFNLETDENAKEVLRLLHEFLFNVDYQPQESEFGHYLICYSKE